MSSSRKVVFANGEYYHVFNRGVEKRKVFLSKADYRRAIHTLDFYRFGDPAIRYSKYLQLSLELRQEFIQDLKEKEPEVEIVAFCLMGNHFHILIKQLKENGISNFLSRFTNSYTKYFNTKYQRVGPLFQGVFKAVHVDSDDQLLHLTRYIHLNPVAGFIVKSQELQNYEWSSYPEYINKGNNAFLGSFIEKQMVLEYFKSPEKYEDFVLDQANYLENLNSITEVMID